MLSTYPAQEISYSKLLGQLHDKGNTDLVKHYIQLYEDAFLFKALQKFSPSKLRIKSSSPKIIPLCPAFYTIQNPGSETKEAQWGRIFEAAVGAQLLRLTPDLFYWRENNEEVDFVLKHNGKIYAIEVKSGRKKQSKGLASFEKQFKKVASIIVSQDNFLEFSKDTEKFLGV